jgi:hypothetical protein
MVTLFMNLRDEFNQSIWKTIKILYSLQTPDFQKASLFMELRQASPVLIFVTLKKKKVMMITEVLG